MTASTFSITPVAVFTYNRPEHTRRVLESLSRCKRLDECSLFIFCDGPKSSEQKESVDASLKVVRSFAEKIPVEVIIREKNFGLARSIVSGVTELCQRFGRVIVIEDDFIMSPSFIDYMLQSLDRYQDDECIYQISGYMFPVELPEKPDANILPFTTTWGWATWEWAWKLFDWDAAGYQELFSDESQRARFDLDNSYPYHEMLEHRFAGKNDSWGILWWYAVFKVHGLVLHPKKSLVFVGGFDGSGTHCGTANVVQTPEDELWILPADGHIDFPATVTCDNEVFSRIKDYLRPSQNRSFISKIRDLLQI